jgi:RimJ/RimL family protein N-acetyltransferase
MFAPTYPIRTERLLLRPLDPVGDVEAVHAYQSNPDVCRYIPYEPRTKEEVAAKLAGARSTLDGEGQALWLAAVEAATDRLVGDVLLFWQSATHRGGELGYVIDPAHQGRGYATEAAVALLGLAFEGLGLHRVIARIDARNAASAGVLRRLGMRQEAHLRENEWFKNGWSDEIDFAVLDDEWRVSTPRVRLGG